MLTLGSRFKARLQVPQNVISSCFFLVFQEAEIHSPGLRPSISMYDVRCTVFASSGSHRHTSLQNPLPRPRPLLVAASTAAPAAAAAGPRHRGHFALHGAATSSLGAPAEVADAEGPVSCMVRWFFRSETMRKSHLWVVPFTHLFLHWPTES